MTALFLLLLLGSPDPEYSFISFHLPYSAHYGVWSANPAGLQCGNRNRLYLAHQHHPGTNLYHSTAGVVISTPAVNYAGSISYTGNQLLSRTELRMAAAYAMARSSVGLRTRVIQLASKGLPTRYGLCLTAGSIISISEKVNLGLKAENILAGGYTNSQELLPVTFTAGIAVRPADKIMVIADLTKPIHQPLRVNGGFTCLVGKFFSFETAVRTAERKFRFGLGFSNNRIAVNYAIDLHRELGSFQQLQFITILTGRS